MEEGHVKFGITPIFTVRKDVKGVTSRGQNVAIADTETKVQILAFEWESYAKNTIVRLPEDKK